MNLTCQPAEAKSLIATNGPESGNRKSCKDLTPSTVPPPPPVPRIKLLKKGTVLRSR